MRADNHTQTDRQTNTQLISIAYFAFLRGVVKKAASNEVVQSDILIVEGK